MVMEALLRWVKYIESGRTVVVKGTKVIPTDEPNSKVQQSKWHLMSAQGVAQCGANVPTNSDCVTIQHRVFDKGVCTKCASIYRKAMS